MELQQSRIGFRHLIAFLLFLGLTISYSLRVNLSIAIVAMTDKNSTLDFPIYDYGHDKDIILSSFFWGYVITQLPAAWIGKVWGPHIPLGVSMLICSLLCFATPWIAAYGAEALIATRIAQGLMQGFLFPSMHNLCAHWVPKSERSRLVTFIYAGAQFGTVVSLSVCGFLSGSATFGWPSIFYTHGIVGLLWGTAWLFLGGNSPSTYRFISNEERKFIEASIGESISKTISTPWKAIWTSLPMWALIIAHCSNNWGFWTLLTEMPSYMKDVLHFDIQKLGFLSSLPYLTMWLLSFVFSSCSDFIINKGYLSIVTCRKISNSIGTLIPAVSILGLALLVKTGESYTAVAYLTIAVGFNSATYCGFQVNHIDLAPNHAGTMMGITNCLGNIVSIIAPLSVGVIVGSDGTPEKWKIVFYIAAAIYLFGDTFFVLCGSASLQPWNDFDAQSNENDIEKHEKKMSVPTLMLSTNNINDVKYSTKL